MFTSYFSSNTIILLVLAGLVYLASILFFQYSKKINTAVLLLLMAAFVLKLFHITLDPFLNLWDEQFHALVAKNLSRDFFKPTLYPAEILPYDFRNWTGNYIWIHKQPLYLWQMALFIKLLGSKVIAIRLPSAICFTFAVFCIYRIGKNLSNQSIGYYAALFCSVNAFFGELSVGNETTDHNDLVFITYVTASLWAFTEYMQNPSNKKWIILIGVFSGMAVLTKWLVGLLVYSGWFFYEAIKSGNEFYKPKKYFNLLKAFVVTLLVFLPWQVYIKFKFPEEHAYESEFNTRHLFEAIEGHKGDKWFHVDAVDDIYGYLAPFFIVLGIVLLYNYYKSKAQYAVSLIFMIIVYGFFAYAATKMISFTVVVCAFVYLGFGAIAYAIQEHLSKYKIKSLKILFTVAVLFTAFSSLKIEVTQEKHSTWKKTPYFYYIRREQIIWKEQCDQINNLLPKDEKYVVFNCPDYMQNIKFMFYTDFIGYLGLPNEEQLNIVKSKGYKAAVFDNARLPDEIKNNSEIKIITLPSFSIKSIDTVFIKSQKFQFMSIDGERKAICNNADSKHEFIIRTYEDNTCEIKSLDGFNATLAFNLGNIILFNRNEFGITERFKIESLSGNRYKIKIEDGTCVKVLNDGERFVATNNEDNKDDVFEIIKK